MVLNRHLWERNWKREAWQVSCDARRTRCVTANDIFLDRDYIGAVIELICYCMTFVGETLCSRLGLLPLKWGQGLKAEVNLHGALF